MKHKYCILILVYLLLTQQLFSQDKGTITPPAVRINEQTPKAPNTAGLGKYIDFPVNMATGIPQITIPLFEIKQGNISLPVNLSYHAGGIKVNESASWVGMGWTLSYGVGTLTKKVNGLDDFSAVLAANNSNIQQIYLNPDFTYDNLSGYTVTDVLDSATTSGTWNMNHIQDLRRFFIRITQGVLDGEADEYYFSTPEGGGKFFYNQKTRLFEFDNNQNWKVIYNNVYDGNYGYYENGTGSWKIISNKGVIYEYSSADLYENPLSEKPSIETGVIPSQQYLADSWVLTQINDVQNNKQINFTYTTSWRVSRNGLYMNADYRNYNGTYYYSSSFADEAKRKGLESVINRIDFDEGYVLFVQDNNPRLDGGINALKEIQLYNNKNKLVRKYVLSYFYDIADISTCSYPMVFGSNWPYPNNAICDTLSKRMFLQNVQETLFDNNATPITLPAYQFGYNFNKKLPCRVSFAQDFWGGANGKTANTTMLASIPANIRQIAYPGVPVMADRSIDTAFLKAGIIKEIIYPTGGKAVFEFEGNTTEAQQEVGGLRIKRITNKGSLFQQQQLVTEYDYNDINGVSTGEVLSSPVHYYDYYQFIDNSLDEHHVKIESDPLANLYPIQSSPVLYRQVTKKLKGQNEDLISKHYFVGYDVSGYYNFQPETYTNHVGVPKSKNVSLDKYAGVEYKTEVYKKTNQGTYELIQKDETIFSPLNLFNKYVWNVQSAWTDPHFFGGFASPWKDNDPFSRNPPNMGATINAYKIYKNDLIVKEKKQIVYNGQAELITSSFFNYDKNFGSLKNSRTVTSEGDTSIQVIKYVANYDFLPNSTNTWNLAINYMLENNVSNIPIEVSQFKKYKNSTDSVLLKSSLFEYENYKIKRIYKIETTTPISNFQFSFNGGNSFTYDSRYKVKLEVNTVDTYGNPITVTENNVTSGYIWDTKNGVVIATASNATNLTIAYSNFETENKGNWVYNGIPVTGSSLNGSNEYNLSFGAITTQNTLDVTKEYFVNFWLKIGSGTCFVNGQAGILLNNKGEYSLYQVKLLFGTTSINITGTGTIDELRLYPANAQMSTFVYEALIGITSQCDANNKILYYSYDGLGRLSVIKDHDNNVIKKICYNYAGQAENCNTAAFTNDVQQATYTSTVCASGLVAPTSTYTVPAGTYSSYIDKATANQLAINAMNTNGQAAANALPCLAPFSGWNKTSQPWNVTVTNTTGTFNATYSFYPGSAASLFANIPVGTYNISLAPMNAGSVTSPVQLVLNGTTYTGTSFNVTNAGINAATTLTLQNTPSAPGPCSLTISPGYSSPTSGVSNNSGVISFYMVFYSTSVMTVGNSYLVGTIDGGCRPSSPRTFAISAGGRNWTIVVTPNGYVIWQLAPGSEQLNPYTTIGTSTLTYNL